MKPKLEALCIFYILYGDRSKIITKKNETINNQIENIYFYPFYFR